MENRPESVIIPSLWRLRFVCMYATLSSYYVYVECFLCHSDHAAKIKMLESYVDSKDDDVNSNEKKLCKLYVNGNTFEIHF